MGTKMYGLRLGRFGMDMEMVLPGHPDLLPTPGETQKKLVWYQCHSLAYVIEHPEGRILFETGLSPGWRDEWPDAYHKGPGAPGWSDIKPEELLEPSLKAAGLGPDDFKYVILGHMHIDHAGGLRVFENAGAEIILHEDEYRGVMGLEEDSYFMCRADYEFLPRKKPTLIYGTQEILKGVKLISLPGHTWGTMGMMVYLDHTGWVLFPSDALIHHKAYGPPAIPNLISVLQDKWGESVERVRRMATKYDALVAPGHDETCVQHKSDGTTELVELKYFPDQVYE